MGGLRQAFDGSQANNPLLAQMNKGLGELQSTVGEDNILGQGLAALQNGGAESLIGSGLEALQGMGFGAQFGQKPNQIGNQFGLMGNNQFGQNPGQMSNQFGPSLGPLGNPDARLSKNADDNPGMYGIDWRKVLFGSDPRLMRFVTRDGLAPEVSGNSTNDDSSLIGLTNTDKALALANQNASMQLSEDDKDDETDKKPADLPKPKNNLAATSASDLPGMSDKELNKLSELGQSAMQMLMSRMVQGNSNPFASLFGGQNQNPFASFLAGQSQSSQNPWGNLLQGAGRSLLEGGGNPMLGGGNSMMGGRSSMMGQMGLMGGNPMLGAGNLFGNSMLGGGMMNQDMNPLMSGLMGGGRHSPGLFTGEQMGGMLGGNPGMTDPLSGDADVSGMKPIPKPNNIGGQSVPGFPASSGGSNSFDSFGALMNPLARAGMGMLGMGQSRGFGGSMGSMGPMGQMGQMRQMGSMGNFGGMQNPMNGFGRMGMGNAMNSMGSQGMNRMNPMSQFGAGMNRLNMGSSGMSGLSSQLSGFPGLNSFGGQGMGSGSNFGGGGVLPPVQEGARMGQPLAPPPPMKEGEIPK